MRQDVGLAISLKLTKQGENKEDLVAEFWARMGGVTISDTMVLFETKIGDGRRLIESIARRKAAAALAWERGIAASEREVEDALERRYADLGCKDIEQIRAFRSRHHLKEEAIRSFVRENLLIDALKAQTITDAAIEERFHARAKDFRLLEIELFSFQSEEAARTFVQAVETGEMEPRLGERRRATESHLPQEAAAALAGIAEGQLAGPFPVEHRQHVVYRLIRRLEPHLDPALRKAIRDDLFRESLEPLLLQDPLVFLV